MLQDHACNPITWKALNPKQVTLKKNKLFLKILGQFKERFLVCSSQNISKYQYFQCQIAAKKHNLKNKI
jgi:hypothetical protein